MKRFWLWLLVLLILLSGCSGEPTATTEPSNVVTEPSTIPTEPQPTYRPDFGLYEPGNAVEQQTGGAVKAFPLTKSDYYAVEIINDGLLLFSGETTTTLTLLREETDPVTVSLNCFLYPDDSMVRVTDKGLYYFDDVSSEIIHLDSKLREIAKVRMPEDAESAPALSADGKFAYYFSNEALRCLELSSGISRLLRVSTFQSQETWGIHFDDTVLECYIFDGQNSYCQYISTATGEMLGEYTSFSKLDTLSDRYMAHHFDRESTQNLFGNRGEKPQCIQLAATQVGLLPLLERNAGIAYEAQEGGTTLSFYSLEYGTCSSQVRLPDVNYPDYVVADAVSGLIWVLAKDLSCKNQSLYCWNTELSLTGDDTNYTTPYYTALEPDREGLAQIAQQAKELGNKYGVRIWTWEDAQKLTPSDYSYETEYLVPVYEKYLPLLEEVLSAYPEGFFKRLGKSSDNGLVTISLVRGLYGDNELGSLTSADGVHFWNNGSGYVAVVMGELMEQTLYHELFHAIDSYVLGETVLYDNWTKLNPEGFEYDYSYVNNQFREDYQYLEDETRAFIDMYSMSFPKEDRARVMEYAMMADNEAYFQSDVMQAKLNTICKGIRKAFGLKKYTEPLVWEQYLKEPLN